jgi:hypothetical protein
MDGQMDGSPQRLVSLTIPNPIPTLGLFRIISQIRLLFLIFLLKLAQNQPTIGLPVMHLYRPN